MNRRSFLENFAALLAVPIVPHLAWPTKPSAGSHPLFNYMRGEVVTNITTNKDGKVVVVLSNNKSIVVDGTISINAPASEL